MAILLTQLSCFFIVLIYLRIRYTNWYYYRSASIAMAAMYFMGAIGHFLYVDGMQLMMPEWLPLKKPLVLLSGIYELLLGINFLIPSKRKTAAKISIVYLILVLPLNIYAAIHHINYVSADYTGPGPVYLWFRIPLQIFWIGWSYFILQWNPLPFTKENTEPIV